MNPNPKAIKEKIDILEYILKHLKFCRRLLKNWEKNYWKLGENIHNICQKGRIATIHQQLLKTEGEKQNNNKNTPKSKVWKILALTIFTKKYRSNSPNIWKYSNLIIISKMQIKTLWSHLTFTLAKINIIFCLWGYGELGPPTYYW